MEPTIEVENKIRVGVSSCLLGEKVRWNGDHKQDAYVCEVLDRYFDWIPCCPEVEIGMGVPREAVHLRGNPKEPRMVGKKSGTDWTEKMNRFSKGWVRDHQDSNLCGYIYKKNSPSCGLERVKVNKDSGQPGALGQGLFAGIFTKRFPLIPVEEEGRLHDARIRENFIVRVFSYHRLQSLFNKRFSRSALVRFHTINKFLLLTHSSKHCDELDRLVAKVKQLPPAEIRRHYSELFMQALQVKTTVKKNVDVLQHMLGFLKKHLSKEERRDILATIQDYRRKRVPLVVPVTLLGHYVRMHQIDYLLDQVYLYLHPKELMLRNHV